MATNDWNGLFDFGSFSDIMSEVLIGAENSQRAEQQRLDIVAAETRQVEDITAGQQRLAEAAAEKLQGINAHAAREAEWAGGGILGQISLLGAQTLDPFNYTAAGRAQQADVVKSTLEIGNMMTGSMLASSQARVESANADAASKQYAAQAATGLLKARVEALNIASQGIMASENLRLANLSKLGSKEILSGLALLGADPNGQAEIGGFKYTKTELLEMDKSIKTRDALALLSPQVTDADYATKLNAHQELILQETPYEKLLEIRDRGGRMADGTVVASITLDKHIERAKGIIESKVVSGITATMATEQLPRMLKDAANRIDTLSVSAKAPPGSPLANALLDYQISIGAIDTAGAMKDPTGTAKGTAMAALAAANQQLDAVIDAEAKQRALGDPQLAEILKAQIYGAPVDPAQLSDYVATRYREGKPLGAVLPVAESQALKQEIDLSFGRMRSDAGGDFGSSAEEKDAREKAAVEGFNTFSAKRGAVAAENVFTKTQFYRKDNPLIRAGIGHAQYKRISDTASQMVKEKLAQEYNVDATQATALFSAINSRDMNKLAEFGLDQTQAELYRTRYQPEAIALEYDLIEQQMPGLGTEYSQWLMANGDALGRESAGIQFRGDSASPDLLGPMAAEHAGQMVLDYAFVYQQADSGRTKRAADVLKTAYMDAHNPTRMLGIAITQIDSLTPREQSSVYNTIIVPTLNAAAKNGLSDEESLAAVTAALDAGSPTDPALTKASKTTLRHLDSAIQRYTNIVTQLTSPEAVQSASRSGLIADLGSVVRSGEKPGYFVKTAIDNTFNGTPTDVSGQTYGLTKSLLEAPGGMEAIIQQNNAALQAARKSGF